MGCPWETRLTKIRSTIRNDTLRDARPTVEPERVFFVAYIEQLKGERDALEYALDRAEKGGALSTT